MEKNSQRFMRWQNRCVSSSIPAHAFEPFAWMLCGRHSKRVMMWSSLRLVWLCGMRINVTHQRNTGQNNRYGVAADTFESPEEPCDIGRTHEKNENSI